MNDWKRLQISLYKDLQREAAQRVTKKTSSLARYEKEFLDDQKKLTPNELKNLIKTINTADHLFIGDYHTLRQSQRFLLRLLRDRRLKKPKYLALEVLRKNSLHLLEAWQKNKSPKNEVALRKSLQLETYWGSHWEAYRELFLLCESFSISLVPLFDPQTNIRGRDKAAAASISKLSFRTWTFIGEYHCARQHLPLELLKAAPEKKVVVLQQNDDRATLKLLKETTEKSALILKAPQWIPSGYSDSKPIDLFCILHTPLWIKYQSVLEHTFAAEDREAGEIQDASDQIQWSLKTLVKFLEDPRYPSHIKRGQLHHIHVYKSDDPHFYRSIVRLPKNEQQAISQQLKTSGLAVSMTTREIFLSEVTINSCSQAAGLYLYQAWSTNRFNTKQIYPLVLLETLSFFLSKLLNHSRRATSRNEIPSSLFKFYLQPPPSAKLKRILGRQKMQAAQYLGRSLADALFEGFLAGEFSRSRLIRILKAPIRDEETAYLYLTEIYSLGKAFSKRGVKAW